MYIYRKEGKFFSILFQWSSSSLQKASDWSQKGPINDDPAHPPPMSSPSGKTKILVVWFSKCIARGRSGGGEASRNPRLFVLPSELSKAKQTYKCPPSKNKKSSTIMTTSSSRTWLWAEVTFTALRFFCPSSPIYFLLFSFFLLF